MYTATRDLMLPTTVTGSWPRPSWYTLGLSGRPLSERDERRRVPRAVHGRARHRDRDQERAGLDILTNGDYHRTPTSVGARGCSYPVERLAGMSALNRAATDELLEYPPDTLLNEILGGSALARRRRQDRRGRGPWSTRRSGA